jgi:glycosyltransferase involved in cell wall biosynthesis
MILRRPGFPGGFILHRPTESQQMKIAVNTRLLLKGRLDGIGWFILEHFSRICKAHPEHEFHFIFDRPFDQEFIFAQNVIPHVIGPPARHPFLFKIWYDFSVPRLLKKIGADIFISPDMMCSLRTEIPQIVVLHDLNFEHFPKDLPWLVSKYLRHYTPLFARRAATVVTVSDFSKRDIVSCYGISPSRVEVVHNGCHLGFRSFSFEEQEATRLSISAGQPYFVFVSSIHPRKNLQRLLPAFDLFKKRTSSAAKLVVVGRKFWKFPELDAVYDSMEYREDVIFTGRLEPEMLNRVTSGALASVYISYYEGFGLPILEAFRCGVPVITSSVTAMPEVAADAALLVDLFPCNKFLRHSAVFGMNRKHVKF